MAYWEKQNLVGGGDFFGVIDALIEMWNEPVFDNPGGHRNRIVDEYIGDEKNPPNVTIRFDSETDAWGHEDFMEEWGFYVVRNGDELYIEPYG